MSLIATFERRKNEEGRERHDSAPDAAKSLHIVARFAGRALLESRERGPRIANLVLPGNNQAKPIAEETAIALRRAVFGQCPAMTRSEFFSQGPGFVFREHGYPMAYGLVVSNPSTTPMMRAMLMAVQAHILRTLLFDSASLKLPKSCTPIMPTSPHIQQEVLAAALSEIIWKAGDGLTGYLCLPQANVVHVRSSPSFNEDGLTERIQVCHVGRQEDLRAMIRRNIHVFQEDPGPGLMLLLYSTILTRGIQKIKEDLGKPLDGDGVLTPVKCLIGNNAGNITFPPISLYLLGRASPYLHNGVQCADDGNGGAIEESGVLIRSPLGLLVWMGSDEKTAALNVGSRLKTPIAPIWLVISGEQSGVLFSEDKGLLRDYQVENKFQLSYYTSSHHQASQVVLKINNRAKDNDDGASTNTMEKIIRTKWSDARVDWGHTEPFV